MSIEELIALRCSEKVLFPVEPLVPSDPIMRDLYVSDEVQKMLIGPWKNQTEENRWRTARAIMEAFISGKILSVKRGRSIRKRAVMCHLDPLDEGVWSIRATAKNDSGVRILGQFAREDLFVALTWDERSILGEGFSELCNSIPWNDIINRCKAKWRNLFHNYSHLTGDDSNAYISDIIIL